MTPDGERANSRKLVTEMIYDAKILHTSSFNLEFLAFAKLLVMTALY